MRQQTLHFATGIFLLMMALPFSQNLQAQTFGREIGVRMTNLTNPNFIYKKQKADNKFVRYRFGFANFDMRKGGNRTDYSSGVGVAIGVERRKEISSQLYFIHGFEPYLNVFYTYSDFDQNDDYSQNLTIRPGLGYVLGLHYNISEKWAVNVEGVPNIYVSYDLSNAVAGSSESTNKGMDAGLEFNTRDVAITVMHRFSAGK